MLEDKQKLLLEIKSLRQEIERLKQERGQRIVLLNEGGMQFLETMPVGIWVTDHQGNCCYTNQRALQIFSQGKHGKLPDLLELYLAGSGQFYPLDRHPLKRALKGEQVSVDDMEFHGAHQVIPLEVWANPVFNDHSEIIYAIVVFQDISQRKQVEQTRFIREREIQDLAFQMETKLQQEIKKRQQLEMVIRQAHQELENLAILDKLTQVANRRRLEEYLRLEWRRLTREKVPLSFIFCDMDGLTLYNDTYGRREGDECLQRLAQAISRAVKRPSDLVARYDSTKFAVILPNTDADGAVQVASAIRWEVKMLKLAHVTSPVNRYVTVSAGVSSTIPTQVLSPEALVQAADDALGEAKKQGKNRVIFKNIS